MNEHFSPSADFDDVPTDLSPELRTLRQQKNRRLAEIQKLSEELNALSHEKLSLLDKIMALGRRARIHTELSKLRLDLRVIEEWERRESNRSAYIAPLEFPDDIALDD